MMVQCFLQWLFRLVFVGIIVIVVDGQCYQFVGLCFIYVKLFLCVIYGGVFCLGFYQFFEFIFLRIWMLRVCLVMIFLSLLFFCLRFCSWFSWFGLSLLYLFFQWQYVGVVMLLFWRILVIGLFVLFLCKMCRIFFLVCCFFMVLV